MFFCQVRDHRQLVIMEYFTQRIVRRIYDDEFGFRIEQRR